jgi:hypothetical protein
MGFNRRKMEDRRRKAAEQEAAACRATERQILEDADHLIAVWHAQKCEKCLILLARSEGFEPPTPRFEVWCSIQLSYERGGRTLVHHPE